MLGVGVTPWRCVVPIGVDRVAFDPGQCRHRPSYSTLSYSCMEHCATVGADVSSPHRTVTKAPRTRPPVQECQRPSSAPPPTSWRRRARTACRYAISRLPPAWLQWACTTTSHPRRGSSRPSTSKASNSSGKPPLPSRRSRTPTTGSGSAGAATGLSPWPIRCGTRSCSRGPHRDSNRASRRSRWPCRRSAHWSPRSSAPWPPA